MNPYAVLAITYGPAILATLAALAAIAHAPRHYRWRMQQTAAAAREPQPSQTPAHGLAVALLQRSRAEQNAYTQGFEDACRARWNANAQEAFTAGFNAGTSYDETGDPAEAIREAWQDYHNGRSIDS